MRRRPLVSSSGGFSLVELVFAVSVLGICAAVGIIAIDSGAAAREARSAAQSCQAAAAWAQVGVLWQGGDALVSYESGSLSVSHEYGLCGGSLDQLAAKVPVTTNPARWREGEGVGVTFGGVLASPDGGGSVCFHARATSYRLTVRPVSGLTVRSGPELRP